MTRYLSLLLTFICFSSLSANEYCYQGETQQECCFDPCIIQECCYPLEHCVEELCGVKTCDWLGFNGIFSDILFWNMYGDGLDWGNRNVIDIVAPIPATVAETNFSTFYHQFDYEPGVRIGINHIFPCTGDDLTFVWTFYKNSNTDSVRAFAATDPAITTSLLSPYLLTPTSAIGSGTGLFTDAFLGSSLNFKINRFDLTLGHNIDCCDCFVLHFYGGPVFWGTNQSIDFAYSATPSAPSILFVQARDIATTYKGAGAQAGFRINWNVWRSLVLTASTGIAGTVGKFSLSSNFTLTAPFPPFTGSTHQVAKEDYWTGRLAASFGLALRYSYCYCGNVMLYTNLGWELYNYFNQTAFLVPTEFVGAVRSTENLVLQGLTFTVGTTF